MADRAGLARHGYAVTHLYENRFPCAHTQGESVTMSRPIRKVKRDCGGCSSGPGQGSRFVNVHREGGWSDWPVLGGLKGGSRIEPASIALNRDRIPPGCAVGCDVQHWDRRIAIRLRTRSELGESDGMERSEVSTDGRQSANLNHDSRIRVTLTCGDGNFGGSSWRAHGKSRPIKHC